MLTRERAGKGKKGSITQFPILTIPGDDITHPIPDLPDTSQRADSISRELPQKGIYPPSTFFPL
ncbi:MAG: hypothetical protein Ct9H90mP24_6920 [Methanobacteriota archaeon]|nr:MAG: hypothetical protein Ct9H90mP24_6920 [Euryarchaeota archaeon]